MKKLGIVILALCGSFLSAEIIGNVEFQFPPSSYDWVLFNEYNIGDAESEDKHGDDDSLPIHNLSYKIYTHKAGDALELFTAVWFPQDEEEEDDDESETAQMVETFLNEQMSAYFPNHRIKIARFDETKEGGFIEWEINDGVQAILHGLGRFLKVPSSGSALLNYSTTANKSEENGQLWTDTLYQAQVLE